MSIHITSRRLFILTSHSIKNEAVLERLFVGFHFTFPHFFTFHLLHNSKKAAETACTLAGRGKSNNFPDRLPDFHENLVPNHYAEKPSREGRYARLRLIA